MRQATWKLSTQKTIGLDGQVRIVTHINIPGGKRVLCPDTETAKLIVTCVNARIRTIRQGRLCE